MDNWLKLSLLVDITYNESFHPSTCMTPGWVSGTFNPTMYFELPLSPHVYHNVRTHFERAGMDATYQTPFRNTNEAQASQSLHPCKKLVTSGVWDEVWLRTRTMQKSRLTIHDGYNCMGSYIVPWIINNNADVSEKHDSMSYHNNLHWLLLNHYTQLLRGKLSSIPPAAIVSKTENSNVNGKLNQGQCYW